VKLRENKRNAPGGVPRLQKATPSASSEIDPSMAGFGVTFTLIITGIIVAGIAYRVWRIAGRPRDRGNPEERVPFKSSIGQGSRKETVRRGLNQI
jgi:hypothetical protein